MIPVPQSQYQLLRQIRQLDPAAEVRRDTRGGYYVSLAAMSCGDGLQSSATPKLDSEREAIYGAWIALTQPSHFQPGKDHLYILTGIDSPWAGKRVQWDGEFGWKEFRLH